MTAERAGVADNEHRSALAAAGLVGRHGGDGVEDVEVMSVYGGLKTERQRWMDTDSGARRRDG